MAIKVGEQENGVTVYQVTDEPLKKSNIYCELPYCSADSRVFVYERRNPALAPNSTEYLICQFGTWETTVAGRGLGGPAMTHEGMFYYRRMAGETAQELVRLDLATGRSSVIYVWPEGLKPRGLGTMSPGERYYAYGVTISYAPMMFGTEVVDLKTGARSIIHTDPYICNPHTQFEPSEGKQVMVQHNRGCEFLPDGTRVKLVGEEGATEFLLDVPGGEVTRLKVGKPYTTPITGHEAWIGNTREILLSVRAEGDFAPEKGNLVAVKAGAPARVVTNGYRVNHVGTSPCGRYFFVDDWQGDSKLVIGSVRTGKTAVVCEAHTSRGPEQDTHGHPYASPDMRWLVFNSDRSGRPEIHVASVPGEMVAGLA